MLTWIKQLLDIGKGHTLTDGKYRKIYYRIYTLGLFPIISIEIPKSKLTKNLKDVWENAPCHGDVSHIDSNSKKYIIEWDYAQPGDMICYGTDTLIEGKKWKMHDIIYDCTTMIDFLLDK